jgi:pyruvate kinase
MVAKYRPPCPVVVVSPNDDVLRQASAVYGLYPCKVDNLDKVSPAIKAGVAHAIQLGLTSKGHRVIIATGSAAGGSADNSPEVSVDCIGGAQLCLGHAWLPACVGCD